MQCFEHELTNRVSTLCSHIHATDWSLIRVGESSPPTLRCQDKVLAYPPIPERKTPAAGPKLSFVRLISPFGASSAATSITVAPNCIRDRLAIKKIRKGEAPREGEAPAEPQHMARTMAFQGRRIALARPAPWLLLKTSSEAQREHSRLAVAAT